ncbi:MAG: cation diffusion facilitator family transporter, partial [Thermoguttaceae bacterium]
KNEEYENKHEHGEHNHTVGDQNLQAAFVHVLADALTSVLAIGALLVGKFYDFAWFDPLVGLLGGIMILIWAYGLIRQTSRILLDCSVTRLVDDIRQLIETDSETQILDLHAWRISENDIAVILSIMTNRTTTPEYYQKLLEKYDAVKHLNVEIYPNS